MSIISGHDEHADTQKPAGAPQSAFAQTERPSAAAGQNDFLSVMAGLNIDRIDSAVEPYLESVLKQVNDGFAGRMQITAVLERIRRVRNAYAFRFDGLTNPAWFVILFASTAESVTPNLLPTSVKFEAIREALQAEHPGAAINIIDARVIIAGYAGDMDRADKMAATIVRHVGVTINPAAANLRIEAMRSTEFMINANTHEAKALEDQLSPHGVRPRIDLGFTVMGKITPPGNNREIRETDVEYIPVGVVGGYMDFRGLVRTATYNNGPTELRHQPVFVITTLMSVIPTEAMGAILMEIAAPQIYHSKMWLRQWLTFNEKDPQPGLLDLEADRTKPVFLKDPEELADFEQARMARPEIVIQFQDGRDNIPGMWRMASPNAQDKNTFIDRVSRFFGHDERQMQGKVLSMLLEQRFEGVIGASGGVLTDSREIDFLQVASHGGVGSIDQRDRDTLMGINGTPTDRARIVQREVSSFTPLWLINQAVVNPDFFTWITILVQQKGLTLRDPNQQQVGRSFGSYLDGFGSAANVGSIVSNGVTNTGPSVGSFWQM